MGRKIDNSIFQTKYVVFKIFYIVIMCNVYSLLNILLEKHSVTILIMDFVLSNLYA